MTIPAIFFCWSVKPCFGACSASVVVGSGWYCIKVFIVGLGAAGFLFPAAAPAATPPITAAPIGIIRGIGISGIFWQCRQLAQLR